ncbi:MAG: molybdopterin molybdotransferase MoeA [Rhodospirillales bacterium]|nr:molybdopterin molybdotransferase MoeA [Rhodospirillales bacterium]
MLSVDEALALVTDGILPLPAETVGIAAAAGRVLAADVTARTTQPPADVSAMDGYAVRAADCAASEVRLRVIGQSAAGHGFAGPLGAGEAVRIFTGAPLPAGADAIVIQEDAQAADGWVRVASAAVAGRWIRRRGADWTAGEALLAAGRRLGARDVGLAAAMNLPWLPVRRRARVAVIATGDEVVLPGEPASPVQIHGGNAFSVAACVRAWGGDAISVGIARDEMAALDGLLAAARGADLLVTIGGASVGDHDLVGAALARRGFTLGFHKVAMRPGKPLICGRLGDVPVLGLPGNPVSVGVTSLIFLKPLLDRLHGCPAPPMPCRRARLSVALAANDGRQDYLRAELGRDDDGELTARPFARQDSALLALFAAADALVIRPPFAPAAAAGDIVDVIVLAEAVPGF